MAEHDERINDSKNQANESPRFYALPIIPHELIVEILSRLPVRSLIQFRCVSKSFKSLISDPLFVKTHFRKIKNLSEKNPNIYQRVALIYYDQRKFCCSCSLDSLINDSVTDSNELDQWELPFKDKLGGKYWIDFAGSCDGLICWYVNVFHRHSQKNFFALCNPSTRFVYNIPDLDFEFKSWNVPAVGLGYDSVMNDYKIVVLVNPKTQSGTIVSHDNRVVIFSQRTKCWRWIEGFRYVGTERRILKQRGTYINGTLCWASMSTENNLSSWIFVSFDLAMETFNEFPLPNHGDLEYIRCYLSVLDGCLACTCHSICHVDVWVMKEFGVRESWTKSAIAPSFGHRCSWGEPLYIADSGEILLHRRDAPLAIYNSKDGMLRISKTNGAIGVSAAVTYIESLVSLEVEN